MIVVEAALNGGRSREEHPRVPCSPEAVARDARECAQAGASVVHIHAQTPDGQWLADPGWYADAHRRIRALSPDLLISITSIRPEPVDATSIIELITSLSKTSDTKPDLISINLGHIVRWDRLPGTGSTRSTSHFPNSYEDITAVLAACRELGIVPELGVMDLGFVSNAVTLRDDGHLPDRPWFLIELDSPAYGSGSQVAPSLAINYDLFAALLREHFPNAAWAAHGVDVPGYDVVQRAIEDGAHVRVGIEDSVRLPDASGPSTNAEQVAWVVGHVRRAGQEPATPAEARSIIGIGS